MEVFGLLTKPLIKRLLPQSSQTEPSSQTSSAPPLENGYDDDGDDPETENHGTLTAKASLKMLFNSPTTTIHYYWRRFDDAVMCPVFGGRGFVSYATGTRDMNVIHYLLDLDEKTESMLKLIEQEADSSAKRAEMYYKKRPELITIIEDLYRSHRALALHYDQATKFELDSSTRLLTQHQTSHSITDVDKSYDSFPDSSHDQDFNESETDDHEIWYEESSSETNHDELVN
ncbi:hypothetical protein R6Q57_000895 [Mikania cordata]